MFSVKIVFIDVFLYQSKNILSHSFSWVRIESPCEFCAHSYGFRNQLSLNSNTDLFSVSYCK